MSAQPKIMTDTAVEDIDILMRYIRSEPLHASKELIIEAMQKEWPDMDAEKALLYSQLIPPPSVDWLVFLVVAKRITELKSL
jgi:hypothetical protein